jgi:transcriptional regulator with XRE-family HTH domain
MRHLPIIVGMARPSKTHAYDPALVAFGVAVRSMRLSQGISQEALADAAGIDRSYMGGIERGEHNVALINLQRIATALDTTVAGLMGSAKL